MATKTKPTEDAALPLDAAPTEDAALPLDAAPLDDAAQAGLTEIDTDLAGPDAPDEAIEQGADAAPAAGGEEQPAADQALTEEVPDAPEADMIVSTIEVGPQQAVNLLAELSPEDRATHLDYFGAFLKAMTPEDRAHVLTAGLAVDAADPEAAREGALTPRGLADLDRVLNELGRMTSGGTVGPDCRAFLEKERALISEGDLTSITLADITATSYFGLHRAVLDWCMAATRKIMAEAV